MPWDDNLEGPALRIAETSNSPLWVAAGPGTGKTFALMRRLARLLEVERATPDRIFVCTFTRTAADDLSRSVAALGISGVDNVKAQTIHAFCFSMLSRQEVLESTGRVPRPLLKSEERILLEDLKHDGLGGIRECNKKLAAFSASWARLQHEEPGWPIDQSDRQFQTTLNNWLIFHHAMLIGELIPEALRYLRLNPQTPYRSMFDNVLVDEYQDLNRAEQQLVEVLANGSLVVIGDEDQSIYSFKHAHPEGIVEFPNTHPTTERAALDECRRCPHKVVAMANSLISNNTSRSNRTLSPFPGNPEGEVCLVQWSDMKKEAKGIAHFVKSRIDSGQVTPGNVLILAPRRAFGYLVRDELKNLSVEAHSFFSEELLDGDAKDLEDCKAQQALVLLTLLANPEDRVALRCWCGFGKNNLNSNPWSKLRNHCEGTGEPPWQVLEQLAAGSIQISNTKPLVERFSALKEELTRLQGLRGEELISTIFPGDQDWAKPFAELKSFMEEDEYEARELLEVIRRHIIQPELPTNVDFVRVMSLHKSKGLTADMVIVVGCLEGLIPSIDNNAPQAEQARSLEEQYRLFYVALTRSKGVLVLSSISRLPKKLAHKMRLPVRKSRGQFVETITSRFLSQLGQECPPVSTGTEFLRETIGQ